MPELAVIIPHFNDMERLVRCLEALRAQDTSNVEIVVADNATPADMSAIKNRFADIRFVTQPERGAAAARNKGVAETTAPWLVFLDADCVPGPGWLDRARQIAAGDTNTITGGRIDVFDETPSPRSGAEAFETVFAFDQEGYIRDKGFSVTANLVATRAAFDATGPMIVGKSEDLDWCHRATAAGHRLVYDAALAVSHPTRQDWPALAKKWRRLTEESFGLLDTGAGIGAGARAGWALRALVMPASVIAHIPRVLGHPALDGREKGRGIATLAGLRLHRMGWMLRQAITGRA